MKAFYKTFSRFGFRWKNEDKSADHIHACRRNRKAGHATTRPVLPMRYVTRRIDLFFNLRRQAVVFFCCWIACLCSCNGSLGLQEAFNKVSEIECFEREEYESNRYGFPKSFEDAVMCIHPNSSCRDKVLAILDKLPKKWLEFEVTADGQIDRFYVAPDSTSNNLLFVHIGQGSGDTVLILFSNANLAEVQDFLAKIKKRHQCR